jgi:hypothetical protein
MTRAVPRLTHEACGAEVDAMTRAVPRSTP